MLHLDITEDNKIGNKICNKMIKVPRDSPENNSETVISEIDNTGIDREIPKGRYIFPEKQQKNINDIRSM